LDREKDCLLLHGRAADVEYEKICEAMLREIRVPHEEERDFRLTLSGVGRRHHVAFPSFFIGRIQVRVDDRFVDGRLPSFTLDAGTDDVPTVARNESLRDLAAVLRRQMSCVIPDETSVRGAIERVAELRDAFDGPGVVPLVAMAEKQFERQHRLTAPRT
jgi:hypothetical protein